MFLDNYDTLILQINFKILLIYLLLSINIVYAEEFYITSDNVILYNLYQNKINFYVDFTIFVW